MTVFAETVTYIMRTFIFNEMSRLQYNPSIGCSTIWRKYGIIIGKLRMFIFVTMEKLYCSVPENNVFNKLFRNMLYGTPFVTKIHLFLGVLLTYKDSW